MRRIGRWVAAVATLLASVVVSVAVAGAALAAVCPLASVGRMVARGARRSPRHLATGFPPWRHWPSWWRPGSSWQDRSTSVSGPRGGGKLR